MKKLLIGWANCTQNKSKRENPKEMVRNRQCSSYREERTNAQEKAANEPTSAGGQEQPRNVVPYPLAQDDLCGKEHPGYRCLIGCRDRGCNAIGYLPRQRQIPQGRSFSYP